MQLMKHAGVALVSAPFVMMGLLMTINGTRRRVLSFIAAGMILVAAMTASAFMAMNNIAKNGPINVSVDPHARNDFQIMVRLN